MQTDVLTPGRDPFDTPDGRCWLVINGDVVGRVDRDELERLFAEDESIMHGFIEPVLTRPQPFPLPGWARDSGLEDAASTEPQELALDLKEARAEAIVVSQLKRLADDQKELVRVCATMLSRTTDPSHLTVAEVARLRRVTERTVRNWIAQGLLTLEVVPGTRISGIKTEQVFSVWLPSRVVKQSLPRAEASDE